MGRGRRKLTLGIVEGTLLGSMCLLARSPAAAADCKLVVDPGGGGTDRTIQAAIDRLPNPGPCVVIAKSGTYHEAVTIAGVNTLARAEEQRVVIRAESPVVVDPPGDHAFAVSGSRFVTVEGFILAGAAREAFVLAGEDQASADIVLARNDVHNNGSVAADGGISIGAGNAGILVVNNLIRNNGRNGLSVRAGRSSGGPIHAVNNTVFGNGWNGVQIAHGAAVHLVNNLIVGNGTDRGEVGGRWGVVAQRTPGPGSPASIVLTHNIFYNNGLGKPAHHGGDVGNGLRMLDPTDAGNLTTAGREGEGIAGCVFERCTGAAAFLALFEPPGFGPHFHLAAGSPAIDRGLGTFMHGGRDWVPSMDFDGDPRPQDGDLDGAPRSDVGCDEASTPARLGARPRPR